MKYYSRRWEALPAQTGSSSVLERVLRARGVSDIEGFLDPLPPTTLLPGAQEAHRRILTAIEKRERIVIIGDYDVDGISSAAILTRFFRFHGLTPFVLLPSRYDEGYGLSDALLSKLPEQIDLLITVDCGITSVQKVSWLMKHMDVIITDHHEPKAQLPKATAVVNPKLQHYPFPELSGSGVVYYLITSLGLSIPEGLASLAMLGTIADVMPLLEENRYLVKKGLDELHTNPLPGLRAWMDHHSLDARDVRSSDIAFRLAPLLNAPGRLDRPDPAFTLLASDDMEEVEKALLKCLQTNIERKTLTEAMALDESDFLNESAVVRFSPVWKIGLLGLAAARSSRRYQRPALYFTQNGETLIGSGRAPEGFDLLASMKACEEFLHRFGGHRQAAGLELPLSHYEAFTHAFQKEVSASFSEEMQEKLEYIPLESGEVGIHLLDETEKLEPYGKGNRPVYFHLRAMTLSHLQPMGKTGKAYRMEFTRGATALRFVSFSDEGRFYWEGAAYDLLFEVRRNVFKGILRMQLLLVDARLCHLLPGAHEPFFYYYYEDLTERIKKYNPSLFKKETLLPFSRIMEEGEEMNFVFSQKPLPSLQALNDPPSHIKEGLINLLPSRQTLISFYRELKSSTELNWRDPSLSAQRFFAMKVFEELGIITYTKHNNRLTYTFAEEKERFDLENSLLYRQSQSLLEAWSESD